MKDNCIFCKIINGELPSKTVYEDKLIKVIMNINPVSNGHLLVLPKKHYENLFDIDEKYITNSIKIIKEKLYPELKEKLNCKGLTLEQNNFYGQEIKHYHIHVIPRYENDNVELGKNDKDITDFNEIYNKLSK